MITVIDRIEAHNEAEFLTKQTGRHVIAVSTDCDCDYSKDCYLCGGDGGYYLMVFELCNHPVCEGDDLECDLAGCAEREQRRHQEAA